MDIKTRIDGLTEVEAKVGLYYLVNLVGATAMCKTCPLRQECIFDLDAKSCKERFLDWVTVGFWEAAK